MPRPYIAHTFATADRILKSRSLTCPSNISTRLLNILVSCISAERESMSPVPARGSMTLQFQKYLKYTVRHRFQNRTLQGCCDYSIWYGSDEAKGGLDMDVIIHAVKKAGIDPADETPCLAYMAIIHEVRKRARMDDCKVYGVMTDSFQFNFLRIDHKSRVSTPIIYTRLSDPLAPSTILHCATAIPGITG